MGAGSTREDEDGPGLSVHQVVTVPPTRGERANQSRSQPRIKPVEQAVQKLRALDSVGLIKKAFSGLGEAQRLKSLDRRPGTWPGQWLQIAFMQPGPR